MRPFEDGWTLFTGVGGHAVGCEWFFSAVVDGQCFERYINFSPAPSEHPDGTVNPLPTS